MAENETVNISFPYVSFGYVIRAHYIFHSQLHIRNKGKECNEGHLSKR